MTIFELNCSKETWFCYYECQLFLESAFTTRLTSTLPTKPDMLAQSGSNSKGQQEVEFTPLCTNRVFIDFSSSQRYGPLRKFQKICTSTSADVIVWAKYGPFPKCVTLFSFSTNATLASERVYSNLTLSVWRATLQRGWELLIEKCYTFLRRTYHIAKQNLPPPDPSITGSLVIYTYTPTSKFILPAGYISSILLLIQSRPCPTIMPTWCVPGPEIPRRPHVKDFFPSCSC